MAVCTFFGHHDCSADVKPRLRVMLTELIEHHGADTFYVGNHGAFDASVWSVLSELRLRYAHIRCAIVLAYMPLREDRLAKPYEDKDTLLLDGIETVPRRYAIIWRNKWMLQRADYVVTYVVHHAGGAAKYEEMAKKQGKRVFCLAKEQDIL